MHSLVLLGDQQQLQTICQQYYASPNNFDVMQNNWHSDIKQLGQKTPEATNNNATPLFINDGVTVEDDQDIQI
jgi:hypothetical protein